MQTYLVIELGSSKYGVGRMTGLGTVEVLPQFGPYKDGREALSTLRSLRYLDAVEAGTVDIYSACPACSGERAVSKFPGGTRGDVIFDCVECGAIFGRVAEVASYVQFPMTSGEARFYFDFTTPKGRVHGWTDDSRPKGRVVQIG